MLRQPGTVEVVEQPADALVQRLDHRAHGRTVLLTPRVGDLLELVDVSLLALERRVDRVLPETEEERFGAVAIDEADGLVRHAVGDVLALGPVLDRAGAEAVG